MMIDWEHVAELREEVGEDSFSEVIELFLEETDEAIAKLEAGLPDEEKESALHFLKGCASNLGFVELSRQCQIGERLAIAKKFDEIDLTAAIGGYRSARAELLARHPIG
ncbi:MAG: Hpt domain-containing protein [Pseudomonadota bacterium]